MAKKKKRKILYHRLLLVLLLAGLMIYGLCTGFGKLWNMINSIQEEIADIEEKIHEEDNNTAFAENQLGTVVIDAGHGGYDDGSVAIDGTLEKNISLDMALKVGKYLEENNVKVVYTRENDDLYWTTDNVVDLQARIDAGYEQDADYFISLHMNDNPDTSIAGYEVYMSNVSNEHIRLAQNIDSALRELKYTNDRGLYDEALTPLMVIRMNEVPAVLVEMGFIRNQNDYSYITDTKNSNRLAEAIAQGIIESLQQKKQQQ